MTTMSYYAIIRLLKSIISSRLAALKEDRPY
nr:MAG TPA: hypothetical protein [Caudoviricetes sp.]